MSSKPNEPNNDVLYIFALIVLFIIAVFVWSWLNGDLKPVP